MAKRVCPWWLGYFLASPLRRLISNPRKLLAPYVREGMTVLEPGPGMGFFTLVLARMVGPSGKVIAIDVQPQMLAGLKRRAVKAELVSRIDARLSSTDSLGLNDSRETVDFTLAHCVVHEMPAPGPFFSQAAAVSKPGALLLLVEPAGHVNAAEFDTELQAATAAGFTLLDHLSIRRSRGVVLRRDSRAPC